MNYRDMMRWVDYHDTRWGNTNTFDPEVLVHSALALGEEAGEVQGVIKKWHRGDMRQRLGLSQMSDKHVSAADMVPKLLEELVDLNIYIAKIMLQLEDFGVNDFPQAFDEAWRNKFSTQLHSRFNDLTFQCALCDGNGEMHQDETVEDLDPVLLQAIDEYLAEKRQNMIKRARKGEADYRGQWRTLTPSQLQEMQDEEYQDIDNYEAMKRFNIRRRDQALAHGAEV